jgi:hypothetical protein
MATIPTGGLGVVSTIEIEVIEPQNGGRLATTQTLSYALPLTTAP